MKKRNSFILFGVFTVASIILSIPFTPLRVSTKGDTGNLIEKTLASSGVDLYSKFKTARSIAKVQQYELTGLDIPMNERSKKGVTESGEYTNKKGNQADENYLPGSLTETQRKSNPALDDQMVFSGSIKGLANNSGSPSGKLLVSSSNSTSPQGSSNPQKTTKQNYSSGQGGTHPGLDPNSSDGDPLGNLPVGDGWLFLLILCAGYAGWRKKLVVGSR